jgi:hypothetical protein
MNKATAVASGVIFTCLLVFPAASQQPTNACNQPEQKQFDFWVGEWKLTWPGPKGEVQHGSNSIHRVLDGCVIEENFSGGEAIHLRGRAFPCSTGGKASGSRRGWTTKAGISISLASTVMDG